MTHGLAPTLFVKCAFSKQLRQRMSRRPMISTSRYFVASNCKSNSRWLLLFTTAVAAGCAERRTYLSISSASGGASLDTGCYRAAEKIRQRRRRSGTLEAKGGSEVRSNRLPMTAGLPCRARIPRPAGVGERGCAMAECRAAAPQSLTWIRALRISAGYQVGPMST